MQGSVRTQLVLLTTAVTALVAIALAVVVQVVLARSTEGSVDTVLEDRTETVISSITVGPDGLAVPDDRLDAGVAVYDGTGTLVAGSVPSSEAAIYAGLRSTTSRRIVARPGEDEGRVIAEPFAVGGQRGVVVVTERLGPYEQAERQALLVCIGAGVLMVALASLLALWVSRRALAPVAAMTRSADEWSEHDLTHRFDPGPDRHEIAALGRTFDRLLDRVATAIRAEQRLTAELAHELRTPLAGVRAHADLALLHPDLPHDVRAHLDDVSAAARRMGETIDSLLELARSESSQALARSCRLVDAVQEAVGSGAGATVAIDVADDVRVLLPTALAVRAIAPVLDNARRLADHVTVSTAPSRPGFVAVHVDDDGPGIPAGDREAVFEPGRTTGAGAGLGLALSRRVARSMGGDVQVGDGPTATRLVVTLPLA